MPTAIVAHPKTLAESNPGRHYRGNDEPTSIPPPNVDRRVRTMSGRRVNFGKKKNTESIRMRLLQA